MANDILTDDMDVGRPEMLKFVTIGIAQRRDVVG